MDHKSLRGAIQNDILKEYIALGTLCFSLRSPVCKSYRCFEYCKTEVPNWNAISISSYHIREAGSTACRNSD
ncbi:MAG: hypothetical protein H6617_03710 [Bdellovibrionaceae bacterium]|nr:hypothetical protein [Pseudobdellovibrionaceae bacterium]